MGKKYTWWLLSEGSTTAYNRVVKEITAIRKREEA